VAGVLVMGCVAFFAVGLIKSGDVSGRCTAEEKGTSTLTVGRCCRCFRRLGRRMSSSLMNAIAAVVVSPLHRRSQASLKMQLCSSFNGPVGFHSTAMSCSSTATLAPWSVVAPVTPGLS
jgi:hypothetical protein